MPSLHRLLLGKFGVYQLGLLAWIGAGMLTFAVVWRVCLAETFAAIFAVIAGASLGLLALLIEYNPSNVVVVLNPIEEMMTFAVQSADSALDSGNTLSAIDMFLSHLSSDL